MARRKSKLTEEQQTLAKYMAAHGMRHEDIALELDITPEELERHLGRDLRRALVMTHLKIRHTLLTMANSGNNAPATIYADKVWDRNCAGQNQPEGQPVVPPQIIIRTENPDMKIPDARQNG